PVPPLVWECGARATRLPREARVLGGPLGLDRIPLVTAAECGPDDVTGDFAVAVFVDVPLVHGVHALEALAGSASHFMPSLGFVWFVSLGGRPGGLVGLVHCPGCDPGPAPTGFHGRLESPALQCSLFGCQKEGDVNIASTAPRGSVRVVGVEPTRPKTPGLESGASANSATPAGPLPGHHTG